MTERSELPEPTSNSSPEHLTFVEAAKRLNITTDAVRMRAHRGKLATIRVNDRTFVLWPQPEQTNELRTERTGLVNRSDVQDDARLEVARLQGELSEVRARLADAQADRDRWHASATAAIERYNHDMAEMRGLLGREQVIALSATTVNAPESGEPSREDASQDANTGPLRDDQPARAPEPDKPSADTLALGWRRWWQRITGNG